METQSILLIFLLRNKLRPFRNCTMFVHFKIIITHLKIIISIKFSEMPWTIILHLIKFYHEPIHFSYINNRVKWIIVNVQFDMLYVCKTQTTQVGVASLRFKSPF